MQLADGSYAVKPDRVTLASPRPLFSCCISATSTPVHTRRVCWHSRQQYANQGSSYAEHCRRNILNATEALPVQSCNPRVLFQVTADDQFSTADVVQQFSAEDGLDAAARYAWIWLYKSSSGYAAGHPHHVSSVSCLPAEEDDIYIIIIYKLPSGHRVSRAQWQ